MVGLGGNKKDALDDLINESQRIREQLLKMSTRLEVFTSLLAQEAAKLAAEADPEHDAQAATGEPDDSDS